jgi:hypothetical protein
MAVDQAGNVLATWRQGGKFASNRYNALTDTWSQPSATTDAVDTTVELAINAAGDAVAWWKQPGPVPGPARTVIQTRRFE